jgi:SAM-dependent methyltransferase
MPKDTRNFQLLQRSSFFLDQCRGKKVLHLGCTNYPYTEESISNNMLLHFELEKVASEIYGLDFDQEGIDILIKHGSKNIFRADLEKLNEVELDGIFDVIVAGDMIEHLNNPGLFLNGVQRFMSPDTLLILTTINAYCAMRFFWYGLRGKRGLAEPVHPDHVSYYSYSTLKLLIERHDLELQSFHFYDIGREHRPHNRWFLNALNDICVRLRPQWADGVIAVCRLSV